jgi:hypothetical protein
MGMASSGAETMSSALFRARGLDSEQANRNTPEDLTPAFYFPSTA